MIFDEFQKEETNEIWIDIYPVIQFLEEHTQTVVKVEGTKEWVQTNGIINIAVEEHEADQSKVTKSPAGKEFSESSNSER